MQIFSWISNEVILGFLGLGLPGLIFLMYYINTCQVGRLLRSTAKERADDRELYNNGLKEMRQMYLNNVSLVKDYEKLSNDLMDTVRLSIQVNTQLVDSIKNNLFCPQVRQKGPERL